MQLVFRPVITEEPEASGDKTYTIPI